MMEARDPSQDEYADLEIRILGRQDQGYPVEITLGSGEHFTGGTLDPSFLPWVPSADPGADGARLHEWLFADPTLRSAWDRSVGRSPQRRVRLRVDDTAPELQALPWELLAEGDPASGAPRPLATAPDTPFSRYVPSGRPTRGPILEMPLRMLVAVANPTNLEEYGATPLDLERERRVVLDALSDLSKGSLQVTFMPQPITLSALDAELRDGYHLLHIVANGMYSEKRGEGALYLADEENSVKIALDSNFSSLLARQRTLQFVFFASSWTARRGPSALGFTFGAIGAGIPFALGSQDNVPVNEYRTFTAAFYRGLFQHGYVDLACNQARAALATVQDSSWHTWMLVSQRLDNRLLASTALAQIAQERAEAVPEPETEVPEETGVAAPAAKVPRRAGSVGGANNDEMWEQDHLEFKHYVEAFARLIRAKETEPPLTIGIFGSWGMGKTFLLKNIERRLGELAAPGEITVHTIDFNAWEYSANEVIWPGLVRKIIKELEKKATWDLFDGPVLRGILRNLRSQLAQSRVRLSLTGVAILSLAVILFWLFRDNLAVIWTVLGALGLSGLIGALKQIYDAISEPLSPWITALFQEGSAYGKPIDHMVQIREDLEFLERTLGDETRVLVLIDDLDRCEPDKAVEVLQAIKLLLNFKKFIVCLGIDARVITRAVEKHYKDLLGPSGASGYEYLDKIVQIPFRIPKPNPDEVREFINQQMGEPLPPLQTESAEIGPEELPAVPPAPGQGEKLPDDLAGEMEKETEPPEQEEEEISTEEAEPSAFTYDELEIFQDLAQFIRPNPRHIKRLLNVYRLVRTLARLKNQQFVLGDPAATMRWLVICAQWPYSTYAMLRYYDELLERRYEGKPSEWPSRPPHPENPSNDLLIHLYLKVKGQLDREKLGKLDYDPDLLWQLLNLEEGRLDWDELRIMRHYTINFNPAVESELMFETPAESEEEKMAARES